MKHESSCIIIKYINSFYLIDLLVLSCGHYWHIHRKQWKCLVRITVYFGTGKLTVPGWEVFKIIKHPQKREFQYLNKSSSIQNKTVSLIKYFSWFILVIIQIKKNISESKTLFYPGARRWKRNTDFIMKCCFCGFFYIDDFPKHNLSGWPALTLWTSEA